LNGDTMDEFKVRSAALDDLATLIRQRRSMFRDMGNFSEAEQAALVDAYAAYLPQALGEGAYWGWLAETAEGRVAAGGGVAILTRLGVRRAYICNVYTEPEYRRRGLARQLMETMLAWCRAEGFAAVNLHASQAGRPVYEKLGFEPTNEMRLMFK
jgi:GNAT superfamily N-acetyltransferase